MKNQRVPQHFRFIIPIIDVLKELGGSGRASEVVDLVVENMNIPDVELNETITSGQSRIKNQIQWARFMLVKAEYLDSSTRGVWALTEKGLKANLTNSDLLDLYELRKQMGKEYRQKKDHKELAAKPDGPLEEEDIVEVQSDYRSELLNTLKSLSPSGFERLCQRLLRESGFEQVNVTGRSGDGGIDGIGLLQVNAFVSFKVIFQCKRYQGLVSPSIVRDFRGAMQGRADKGIIMTTGNFSKEAKNEARRDGVPPIELVDGEKLIEMFEKLELGLEPIKSYEVKEKFFDDYR